MDSLQRTVCLVGAFDTKGTEYAFVRKVILEHGCRVYAVNTGVLGTTDLFPVDTEADEVAGRAGTSLDVLRAAGDRGQAMKAMCAGLPRVLKSLYDKGAFDAVLGMGGTGGTTVVTAGMRGLPLGVPKVCVSTAASGNVEMYVETKDIAMIPSIVDVAGINRVSRLVFTRAAGAVCGMVNTAVSESEEDKPVIAASMFGNTTECVSACADLLGAKGYEVLVFHATGTGGKAMESLASERVVDAVLDITTTEWADTVCGGVFDAGPERLGAPGKAGIPHLIVPGCIDMANFGAMDTVPARYREAGRLLYEWNPSVTLMRTNKEENRRMARSFAEKANAAQGPVAFLLPLRGVSILDGEGERFCDWETDTVFYGTLRDNLDPSIEVVELDHNINDPEFAAKATEMMMGLIGKAKHL